MGMKKSGQSGERHHVCRKCVGGRSFKSKYELTKHNRRIHEARNSYYCSFCETAFYTQSELDTHVRQAHTGEKPYVCTQCPKSLASKGILAGHSLFHLEIKPHACTHCAKSFVTRSVLAKHLQIHTGEKPFSCDKCGKHFRLKNNLKTHSRIHTGEKSYSCEYCSRKYGRKAQLEDHLRSHTGERPYQCDQCSTCFSTRRSMKHHVKSLHNGARPRFKCTDCNREYSYKTALRRHVIDHHPSQDQQVRCRKCGDKFRNHALLRHHQKEHHSKPFDCDFCGRSYPSRNGVITHIIAHHTGEKPFSCHVRGCGRAFVSSRSLAIHTQTHQTDWVRPRPFVCKWCKGAYYEQSYLRLHYRCCKQTPEYKKRVAEAITENTKTGEHKLFCNTCAKPFPSKSKLTEHFKIHDFRKKKSFACVHCGKTAFSHFSESCLALHMARSAKCINHRRRRRSESCHVSGNEQNCRDLRVVLSPISSTLLKAAVVSNKLRTQHLL